MQIHLTINLGGLVNQLKLDENGNPIDEEEIMDDPMEMTLDGLLAGAKDKYDWVTI